jgi:hypothetical protein
MKKAYRHFKKNLISQGLVDPGTKTSYHRLRIKGKRQVRNESMGTDQRLRKA